MSSTQQLFHNVAIVGATGPGLGNALVEAFLSNKVFNVNVRFLYREESAKDSAKKANVDALEAKGAKGFPINEKDVNSVAAALKGVDVVVSALGVPALIGGAEKLFVDAAALAGAKRFVNSAWGIDAPATSPEFVAKEEAPKYITGRGLEFSNFTTGVWLEYTAGPFFGFDFEKFAAYVPEDGKFYFSATSLHDIAKLTTYAIQHPTSKNNTVYFSGNSLSWNEYLAVLERAFGRKFLRTQKNVAQLQDFSASLPDDQWLAKFGLGLLSLYPDPKYVDFRETAFDRLYPEFLAGVKFLSVEEFVHSLANKK